LRVIAGVVALVAVGLVGPLAGPARAQSGEPPAADVAGVSPPPAGQAPSSAAPPGGVDGYVDPADLGTPLAPAPVVAVPTPEPAEPEADPRPRSDAVARAWFEAGSQPAQKATRARLRGYELGQPNLEAGARALLATAGGSERLSRALLAVRLAPDLPLAHMALASARWQEGEHHAALRSLVAGLSAIPRHLEASLWAASTLLVVLTATLLVGSLFFMAFVGLTCFSHAAHDLADLLSRRTPGPSRAALLAALLLVPVLVGEGLLGLVLGLFALGMMYGASRHRRALVLAVVLLVIAAYPAARISGIALAALDSDPVAQSVLRVVRGTASPADLALLKAREPEDLAARHALALRARRVGDDEAALERYSALLAEQATDPVVMTNVANLRFLRGETDAAIDLYERASGLADSAGLLFNLSQAYARDFRMDEFEAALQRAQKVDSELVAEFSRYDDSSFVADMPYPESRIRSRMIEAADGEAFAGVLRASLMPGWLGASWIHTAVGFVAAAVLAVLLGGRFEHASLCSRCGTRICSRCDGTVWNSEICDGCHHLFHRPETTDPKMRMARLAELRRREQRIDKLCVATSLLVPGASGLWARRPDLSFVGVLLFAAMAAALLWRGGVVPDPLVVGAAGPLAFAIAAALAGSAYLLVALRGVFIRRSA